MQNLTMLEKLCLVNIFFKFHNKFWVPYKPVFIMASILDNPDHHSTWHSKDQVSFEFYSVFFCNFNLEVIYALFPSPRLGQFLSFTPFPSLWNPFKPFVIHWYKPLNQQNRLKNMHLLIQRFLWHSNLFLLNLKKILNHFPILSAIFTNILCLAKCLFVP